MPSSHSPPTWFRYDAKQDKLVSTQLTSKPSFNFADATVLRDVAISKDGTNFFDVTLNGFADVGDQVSHRGHLSLLPRGPDPAELPVTAERRRDHGRQGVGRSAADGNGRAPHWGPARVRAR